MAEATSADLTQEVKEIARRHGAVLVGVASVDRFDPMPPVHDAPPAGQHPRDFVPEARAVISMAMPILNPVMEAPAALAEKEMAMVPDHAKYEYLEVLYDRVGHELHDYMLEFIGQMIGQHLLGLGYDAMVLPTTGLHPQVPGMSDLEIWEGPSPEWAAQHSPLRYTSGPFSHRHAATRAGLGEFGYNNLVLTPEFGPRQRFNSVITDAPLVADPLITKPICLRDACRLCQEACIMGCISLRDDPSVHDYRSLASDARDRIFIDTPARTDPTKCRRRRENRPDSPVRGDCVRVCPVPRRPKHVPERLRRMLAEWELGKAPSSRGD
jgi:epoxyqueuosine reductase QueG